jgi:hypothetical protein
MDKKVVQEALEKKFPVDEVKQREGGFGKKLDYIGIDSAIGRMNEVLPMGYSWVIDDTVFVEGSVVVTGTLTIETRREDGSIELIKRSGIGADVVSPKDIDKSVKTAYAEAFKKACNTLGVALYLWDADERAEIARERQNGGVVTKRTFSGQQLEKMKFVRSTLKLSTDEQLNEFLKKEYKNANINTKADLTPENIKDFFEFADTRITAMKK